MPLGLAGDTMLGRKVGAAIAESGPESLVAEDMVAVAREADLLVLNRVVSWSARRAEVSVALRTEDDGPQTIALIVADDSPSS